MNSLPPPPTNDGAIARKLAFDKEQRIEARAFRYQLDSRRFDHKRKPEPLQAIYTLAGKALCTPGNLTTICAQVKSGKSAVVGAMMSSVMVATDDQTRDTLGFWSSNPKGFALLHFDSEQSPDDHWWLVHRALKRAGLVEPPTWLHSYCLTGLSAKDCWSFVINATAQAGEQCAGVHSILIDGAADLVANVNDPAESNAFVAELHGLAIEYLCPIIGVIHFNPGGEKTRGHLGSQLERKAETNLRLDKDHDVITMWSEKQRRAPICKQDGPSFTWSDKEDMHVGVDNPTEARAEARAEAKRATMAKAAGDIFAHGEINSLRHKELVAAMVATCKKSEPWAKKQLKEWVENQIVRKDEDGNYRLEKP